MLVGDPLQESRACDHRGSLAREWRATLSASPYSTLRSLDLAERAAAAPSRARPPPAKVEALCARDFCPAIGQQTAQPHIYSAGDVIGFPALVSRSMEQARVAMVHACDLKYKQQAVNLLPFGVYTIPECSMVKDTEDTTRRKDGLVPVTMPEAASSVTTLAS
jgi:hypothetical protein